MLGSIMTKKLQPHNGQADPNSSRGGIHLLWGLAPLTPVWYLEHVSPSTTEYTSFVLLPVQIRYYIKAETKDILLTERVEVDGWNETRCLA